MNSNFSSPSFPPPPFFSLLLRLRACTFRLYKEATSLRKKRQGLQEWAAQQEQQRLQEQLYRVEPMSARLARQVRVGAAAVCCVLCAVCCTLSGCLACVRPTCMWHLCVLHSTH